MNEQAPGESYKVGDFPSSVSWTDASETRGCFSSGTVSSPWRELLNYFAALLIEICVLADGETCYLYDGPVLKALKSDGASLCSYDFSKLPTSNEAHPVFHPNIMCVTPFNEVNILVGLEDLEGKGYLVLLNTPLSKVLRTINIPFGVSIALLTTQSVCVVAIYSYLCTMHVHYVSIYSFIAIVFDHTCGSLLVGDKFGVYSPWFWL